MAEEENEEAPPAKDNLSAWQKHSILWISLYFIIALVCLALSHNFELIS